MAESTKDTGIQMKYVFIAIIAVVSTLLFVSSIVLLAIGYMNPFGTVGLGILGGGCIAYFTSVLFFCASSIWVKNRYYPDTTDFGGKKSGEDTSLLKPASNLTSITQTEVGFVKETNTPVDNKAVPLYSASTVYSYLSSASSVPEKGLLCNWQGDDVFGGAMESEVFTTSPTAMQHTYAKSQERLQTHRGSTDWINIDSSVQSNRDTEKTHREDLHFHDGKSIPDIPRQRKPLVIDALELVTPAQTYIPHGNGDKQLEKYLNNIKSKTTKDNSSGLNTDIFCGNKKPGIPGPPRGRPITTASSKTTKDNSAGVNTDISKTTKDNSAGVNTDISKTTKDNSTGVNTDIFGGNKKPGIPAPPRGTPITTASSKPYHHITDRSKQQYEGGVANRLQMLKSGSQEWDPTLETSKTHGGEKGMRASTGDVTSTINVAQKHNIFRI